MFRLLGRNWTALLLVAYLLLMSGTSVYSSTVAQGTARIAITTLAVLFASAYILGGIIYTYLTPSRTADLDTIDTRLRHGVMLIIMAFGPVMAVHFRAGDMLGVFVKLLIAIFYAISILPIAYAEGSAAGVDIARSDADD